MEDTHMSDVQHTVVAAAAVVTEARKDLKTAIAEYDASLARWETAKAKNDKKAAFSETGVMSVRSARIAKAELVLAEAVVEDLPGAAMFEPWVKPQTSAKASRRVELTQAEIEASIAKAYATTQDPRFAKFETVLTSADQRISSLLKQAKVRGYSVKDPR